jgi:hypothetical protein
MQLQLGEVSAIIISSPDLAKEVLKTHDTAFANQPSILAIDVLSYGYSGIVFTPHGDYWRQIRKIFVRVELLSAKRVLSFRSVQEEEACNLVESISLSGGFPINLSCRQREKGGARRWLGWTPASSPASYMLGSDRLHFMVFFFNFIFHSNKGILVTLHPKTMLFWVFNLFSRFQLTEGAIL